jgi:hypothetical protein
LLVRFKIRVGLLEKQVGTQDRSTISRWTIVICSPTRFFCDATRNQRSFNTLFLPGYNENITGLGYAITIK